ncbi:MAG: hypothetical protein A2X13_08325 [Bacteroidetes bacterium GWC2_33_15]|nr:MAG: hypothetical protein A2X10_10155 [Bacteroidetes bacterium GWA2_33_15]OFX51460.1 MAG: hypothetical protein A2X13_08325 [Bacteroidetes bacterium GWC2_33_15]OFX65794.1 MAG: hypothetical protein A2X15_13455 [Bacteroidetes bacterium GWB2_32_14]OFX69488.1 MAG: hypothetical protein A2X14_09905 [Bacteroidetes bacterium GWD2_33_33]HAN17745.1 hypothetical protein [Bacteroidales bacterium]
MRKLIFTALYFLAVFGVQAQNTDSLWVKANDYFVKNNFEKAIETYQVINNRGLHSAELYYNMGNTYYKLNKIAQAILYYEKAAELAPHNDDIAYNLELANRNVLDKIEKIPVFFITAWGKSFINLFSSDLWAKISIVSFIIALVFISIFLYTRRYGLKKLSFWFGIIIIFTSILSFYCSYNQKQKIIKNDSAIIMNPSVTVKSSPDFSGTDLFVIHEGTKVWITDEISEWKEIKLSDGSKGWLKSSDIEII